MMEGASGSEDGLRPTGTPVLLLEVKNLEAGYGRTTILRDVNVAIPSGGIVALLGPNGAGKTTFLRTVSGFIPPKFGTISLFGEDVTGLAVHKRFDRGLCHIPEGRGVFRSLTVRENIVMQSVKKQEDVALERAMTSFPILGKRLTQRAGTMSGGEQQMLAMAAAYVRSPRLIMVDEASLGLAPLVVEEIFGFLERVCASGTALLLIDQFANRVLPLATSTYVMNQGRIVFAGPPETLREGDLFARYVGQ